MKDKKKLTVEDDLMGLIGIVEQGLESETEIIFKIGQRVNYVPGMGPIFAITKSGKEIPVKPEYKVPKGTIEYRVFDWRDVPEDDSITNPPRIRFKK